MAIGFRSARWKTSAVETVSGTTALSGRDVTPPLQPSCALTRSRYLEKVIQSFGDKATEQLWKTGRPRKGFPGDIKQRALDLLQVLNAATGPEDMRFPPGNRLELLGGGFSGLWSIRVNQQWRIVFGFAGENAFDVTITDYR